MARCCLKESVTLSSLPRFAQQIAGELQYGDVVAWVGPMGAGKTTLIRAVCGILGVEMAVTSPTYSLFQTYDTPHGTILHGDLYRLAPNEINDVMHAYAEQMADLQTLTMLEWADLAPDWSEDWTVSIHIRPEYEDARLVEVVRHR